jgi:hypothetical protein
MKRRKFKMKYDFSGWATKNNLKCSDGRTIMKDAFKENDGQVVPLVWNHQHNDVFNVLGHALLKNKDEGTYAYCSFNGTESGQQAKALVDSGDVVSLSIYANQLKERNGQVFHGNIREVSLVLAGANPGAVITNVIKHGEDVEDEAFIVTGENIELFHSDDKKDDEGTKEDPDSGKTIKDVFDSMTEEQRTAAYYVITQALNNDADDDDDNDNDQKEDKEDMKHNVFDRDDTDKMEGVIMHSDGTPVTVEEVSTIFADAKRYGSLKDSVLQHGIEDIEYLFPDAKNVTQTPQFIKRDTGWVSEVMGAVHHTPFSRIKSLFADITEDDARAKGYIKGKLKKEEFFSLIKRTTTPTTVYKKQKLDRDDVIDITDFDVVSWIKSEMRGMLDEEIARAVLVGDGRISSSDDKINETNIRPIWKDEDLYTIKARFTVSDSATDDDKAQAFIRAAIKARKEYKGSGNPVLYTTEDVLTDCLLLTDKMGRDLYDSVEKLAKKLRVSKIVTVPVMEGLTNKVSADTYALYGIIANLSDYNIGADKGGAINMFDDFDIDYNAQKYLIETRCSGALIKPYSAIAIELKTNPS